MNSKGWNASPGDQKTNAGCTKFEFPVGHLQCSRHGTLRCLSAVPKASSNLSLYLLHTVHMLSMDVVIVPLSYKYSMSALTQARQTAKERVNSTTYSS